MNHQESAPTLTKVQQEKKWAMEQALRDIEAEAGQDIKKKLEVAKRLLEEVKGKDYRREQALAKLVEYFTLLLEVEMRKEELERNLSGVSYPPAVNDQSGLEELEDDKYLVKA